MTNYTISTPFAKGLITLGMLLTAGSMMSFAAGISATKTYDDLVMQAPASLSVKTPAVEVNGAGLLKYKFDFNIDNGCCMQVKAELMRQVPAVTTSKGQTINTSFLPPTVMTSKTFQLCGSQANNQLTFTLNASQDDAQFFVQFSNPDTWDKAHLTIANISVLYPTGVISLSTDPSTPLTLLQGQDQVRSFTVPDGKVGKLNISFAWTGGGKLNVKIFKPGQDPETGTSVANQSASTGTLTLTSDIPVTANDSGDWHILYTNSSTANTPDNSIATTIKMTVNE